MSSYHQKIRTLDVVERFWAKIHHDAPSASIFWENHFLIIFDFWIVGLWTLSAEFWFIRPNTDRSVIFSNIFHFGEEFFTRSSYDQNFIRIKKYKVRAFQRRVERTCSPLQCWDILSWTSKSHSTLSFGKRFHMCYIMVSGSNRLYTSFPNIFSLLSTHPKKIIFPKKSWFFIENPL